MLETKIHGSLKLHIIPQQMSIIPQQMKYYLKRGVWGEGRKKGYKPASVAEVIVMAL